MAMTSAAFAEKYCQVANEWLVNKNKDTALQPQVVYDQLVEYCADSDELVTFLNRIHRNFETVLHPTKFFNRRTRAYDAEFFQIYELMRQTFSADVLEEKEVYLEAFPKNWEAAKPSTMIMLGRFWHVAGPQQYDDDGKLVKFSYDPAYSVTEIAATISGTYMSMAEVGRKESIGGVGYAVTRHGLRGGGHGTAISQAYESEMRATAEAYGETFRLMIAESETAAQGFWANCGYRWPRSCVYIQPPISFNQQTGEPNFPTASETLMVKIMDTPNAEVIERKLLLDSIRVMLKKWFGVFDGPAAAVRRADDLIFGDIFPKIEASLSAEGDLIPLVIPPMP